MLRLCYEIDVCLSVCLSVNIYTLVMDCAQLLIVQKVKALNLNNDKMGRVCMPLYWIRPILW